MGLFINHYDKEQNRRFYPNEKEQETHDKAWKKSKSYGFDDKTADFYGKMAVLNMESDSKGTKKYTKDKKKKKEFGLGSFISDIFGSIFTFIKATLMLILIGIGILVAMYLGLGFIVLLFRDPALLLKILLYSSPLMLIGYMIYKYFSEYKN